MSDRAAFQCGYSWQFDVERRPLFSQDCRMICRSTFHPNGSRAFVTQTWCNDCWVW